MFYLKIKNKLTKNGLIKKNINIIMSIIMLKILRELSYEGQYHWYQMKASINDTNTDVSITGIP